MKLPVQYFIIAVHPLISQSMEPNWEPRKVTIESIEGVQPAFADKKLKSTERVVGAALKLNHEYRTIINIRFMKPVQNADFLFDTYGYVPCQMIITPPSKGDYQEGDRERIVCTFKPLKTGRDMLGFTVRETKANGVTYLLRDFMSIGMTVRPKMDWGTILRLQGLSMAAREGALALLLGASLFLLALRIKVGVSGYRLIYWVFGWLLISFVGQLVIWFLFDRIFLSMPESIFTMLRILNLPATISVVICCLITWFSIRRRLSRS